MQTGFTVMVSTIFAVIRTVQIFSRIPGTTGGAFFGIYLVIGWVIQLFYVQMNIEASGRMDAMPELLWFWGPFAWLVVHRCCYFRNRFRGRVVHSASEGIGILYRWLPAWSVGSVGLASDILVALVMGLIFHLTDNPILGSWYIAMIVWLIVAHAITLGWMHMQMERFDDAQIESEAWNTRLQERRRWLAGQRERWGGHHHG